MKKDNSRKWTISSGRKLSVPVLLLLALSGGSVSVHSALIGSDVPASFSLCEGQGATRPECEGSDIRFQMALGETQGSDESEFGFSMATGHLNADDHVDLVVGDPLRNRVYIFYGRISAKEGYDLDPEDPLDRAVSPDARADVILIPGSTGQINSFGFAVAIGEERVDDSCSEEESAAPLVIGAPGTPGEAFGSPGTVFYIPAGVLCGTPANLPVPVTVDASEVGQAFRAPVVEDDDEFGYAVSLGRILENTGTGEDVIVGARAAANGAGSVTIFPVTDDVVGGLIDQLVRIEGEDGDGLGEVLAAGDLDLDVDEIEEPFGETDDLVISAVGHETGKILLVQGPLSPSGGEDLDGLYREIFDAEIRTIVGESAGDFFGFSIAISNENILAVGAIYADNVPPDPQDPGVADERTNVSTGERINGGKVYLYNPGVFLAGDVTRSAATANLVLVARRSADHLGFGVTFADLDKSGTDDFVMTARREDGSGLEVDEIDQGTAYVIMDDHILVSPVDLNRCSTASDCTGVSGINVMIFGGDREADGGDEIGFAVVAGDFNGDAFADIFLSSLTHNRVYAVSLEDTDDDRAIQGRNIRDDDDDGDDDPDSTDCDPLDPEVVSGAEEITCNGLDENCNGMEDDSPDEDADEFGLCGGEGEPEDCDDTDPTSYPGATETCDGNDNSCNGIVPLDERDADNDNYVVCEDWDDIQGDNENILAGLDCDDNYQFTFPGAAPNEADPAACMEDSDEDDYGDISPRPDVTPGTDCDDRSAFTYPGAALNESDPAACMEDSDEDDFGDQFPRTGVTEGTDCDDTDPASYPGAPELCDGNDNPCIGDLRDEETDLDNDSYIACTDFADVQGDNPEISGGADCNDNEVNTFPGAALNETVPDACRKDSDGDDFGDLVPPAGAVAGTDCDDSSAVTHPGAAAIEGPLSCMKDGDGDGFGDSSVLLPVAAGTDCDDDSSASFPGAVEIADDGIDQDCNGFDTVTCYVDDDGDGFGSAETISADDGDCDDPGESLLDTDCDDSSVTIAPGEPEIPDDGVDQDCNGSDTISCFVDDDSDGFGTTLGTGTLADDGSCDADEQESTTSDDCDDDDPATYPGAAEACDGNVNTCGGTLPEDETDPDSDGYVACTGWDDVQGDNPGIEGGGDCDEADAHTFPGAAFNESVPGICAKDRDADGFGDLSPPEGVTPGTDCDDDSPEAQSVFPGAAPLDNPLTCMKDMDDDDYGDAASSLPVVPGTDCDDTEPQTFSGADELCDGNDNACTGAVNDDETDMDGDAYVACAGWDDTQGDDADILGGGDCDELDSDTFPGAAPNEPVPDACMRDKDGDDFGDQTPPAGVTAGTDCDDAANDTFPGAAHIEAPLNCMKDTDNDGYGDDAVSFPIVPGNDCNDDESAVSPGTLEGPFGDPTCSDSVDNDCDTEIDVIDSGCDEPEPCPDADVDGYADCTTEPTCDSSGLTCGDCDDDAVAINPAATEVCDNQDNNCDAAIDEGFDLDDDRFTICQDPVPDCDDTNPLVNPSADEQCADGVDNDCNPGTTDIFDADNDGAACDVDCNDDDPTLNLDDVDMDTFSTCAGDCDDVNDALSPGLPEVCNDGFDNDCNPGTLDIFDGDADGVACDVDCDDDDPTLNLDDADLDTFTSCDGDCDDANAAINPLAEDTCDGVDNNCDGILDEDFDLDGDGYSPCSTPTPDCNEANPDMNPGETEICDDGLDNDCNGLTFDLFDGDADGSTCEVDCDDGNPNTYPGAPEACDGNDNDCDTLVPANEADVDGDAYVACSGWNDTQGDDPLISGGDDCDETDTDTFPGAAPNETIPDACRRDKDGDDYGDQTPPAGVTAGTDCDDGSIFTFLGAAEIEAPLNCMKDVDDDGWGDDSVVFPIVPGNDCNDDDPTIYLGAPEVFDDGIDQDCNGVDTVTCFVDGDEDGFGNDLGITTQAADGTCDTLEQESSSDNDCDDGDEFRYPGAPEICGDGIDSDCDGVDPPCRAAKRIKTHRSPRRQHNPDQNVLDVRPAENQPPTEGRRTSSRSTQTGAAPQPPTAPRYILEPHVTYTIQRFYALPDSAVTIPFLRVTTKEGKTHIDQ